MEDLKSCDKLKLGDNCLHITQLMMQHVARDDSGLSPPRRKDAACFLRWIMSVIPDAVIRACYRKPTKIRALENRVSSIILNVYQNAGIEKGDGVGLLPPSGNKRRRTLL